MSQTRMNVERARISARGTGRRAWLIWAALAVALLIPLVTAASSPLLQWREPVYIMAGFAGVFAMALLLCQPLLIIGCIPGLEGPRGRRWHPWLGGGLLAAVVVHVVGLWITSPPDVVDALLFRSPTPFALWGVIAMWALLGSALLGLLRRQLRSKRQLWRFMHTMLALIVVSGSVIHAVQIDGTMGILSKTLLCAMTLTATVWATLSLKSWAHLKRAKS